MHFVTPNFVILLQYFPEFFELVMYILRKRIMKYENGLRSCVHKNDEGPCLTLKSSLCNYQEVGKP